MRLAYVLVALAACSSGQTQISIDPPPAPVTKAVLAGPLCGPDGTCKCRDETAAGDGGAGEPDGARKRFEIKLGPTDNDLWAIVDGQVLYKSKERPTDCFYLDLPSGDHQVTLRASRPNGVQAGMAISEYGVGPKSWYKTLKFTCGIPGVCSHDELGEIKVDNKQYKGGIHDPCGSVRIRGLTWDTGVAPDQLHPEDLVVRLTLDIYKFKPDRATGDPKCGAGDAASPGAPNPDEPAPDEPEVVPAPAPGS